METDSCKVVSFVSFKGGSGRSVSLANVAYQLAKRHRVGCIDFDIEAGGLHKIFDIGDPGKDSLQHYLMADRDLAEYLEIDSAPDYTKEEVFSERLVIDVVRHSTSYLYDDPSLKGELYLIQAQPNADLTGKVDTGMNMFWCVDKLIKMFSQSFNLDYILIDCRSGISNLGLPGLAYCDLVALFLRWGTQHRYGTETFLKWYSNWIRESGVKQNILLVPSTINPELVTHDMIQMFIQNELQGIPNSYLAIPQVDILWAEDIVIRSDMGTDAETHYRDLAESLTKELT